MKWNEGSPSTSEMKPLMVALSCRWRSQSHYWFLSFAFHTCTLSLPECPTQTILGGTCPTCLPFSGKEKQKSSFTYSRLLVVSACVLVKVIPVWWHRHCPLLCYLWSWKTQAPGSRSIICCRSKFDWPLSNARSFEKWIQIPLVVNWKSDSSKRINHCVTCDASS